MNISMRVVLKTVKKLFKKQLYLILKYKVMFKLVKDLFSTRVYNAVYVYPQIL